MHWLFISAPTRLAPLAHLWERGWGRGPQFRRAVLVAQSDDLANHAESVARRNPPKRGRRIFPENAVGCG